jgi:hypothetical protein
MRLRTTSGEAAAIGPLAACAWPDVAGAGLAALASLEPAERCTSTAVDLIADGLTGAHTRGPHARLVNFSNCVDGTLVSSALLFLVPVDEAQTTDAAAAMHAFLTASATPPTLVPVAATRFPLAVQDDSGLVRAITLNGASHKRPGFPPDMQLLDGVLAALLHLCRAAGTPTVALLAEGTAQATEDDARDTSRALAAATCGILGCGFTSASRWEAPRERGSGAGDTMMYL